MSGVGEHVGVTLLIENLPGFSARVLIFLTHILAIGFGAILAWEGWFLDHAGVCPEREIGQRDAGADRKLGIFGRSRGRPISWFGIAVAALLHSGGAADAD